MKDNTVTAWTLLAMLPKCVLPAPHRVGRKGHTSYSNHVKGSLLRWQSGEYASLWKNAESDFLKKRDVSARIGMTRTEVRADLLARQGELSRAITALISSPLAPDNAESLAKFQKKHPCRLPTLAPHTFPTTTEIQEHRKSSRSPKKS